MNAYVRPKTFKENLVNAKTKTLDNL